MGKEARMKEIRKQLRNVVKENMAEVLKNELVVAATSQVKESAEAQLTGISLEIRTKLQEIDDRSKDFQSFIMRKALDSANPTEPVTMPSVDEDKKDPSI